jgi:hypothetical protein
MTGPSLAHAEKSDHQGDRDHRRPVYQRRAFEWTGHHGDRHGREYGHNTSWVAPHVNAGWFQRPYPYHLDYYKMRYGGSYAPYFGNLYGPPQVVTAPPYYGPYYGGYEYGYPGEHGTSGVYAYPTPPVSSDSPPPPSSP